MMQEERGIKRKREERGKEPRQGDEESDVVNRGFQEAEVDGGEGEQRRK